MNLEQLRKQAKDLVKAARAGDAGALARLGDLPPQLASAQLVLAREHGYSSWPALVHEVAEQPFHTDLHYYEGRAYGIATVNGTSLAEARRDLAQRHGLSSWAELARRVRAHRPARARRRWHAAHRGALLGSPRGRRPARARAAQSARCGRAGSDRSDRRGRRHARCGCAPRLLPAARRLPRLATLRRS